MPPPPPPPAPIHSILIVPPDELGTVNVVVPVSMLLLPATILAGVVIELDAELLDELPTALVAYTVNV